MHLARGPLGENHESITRSKIARGVATSAPGYGLSIRLGSVGPLSVEAPELGVDFVSPLGYAPASIRSGPVLRARQPGSDTQGAFPPRAGMRSGGECRQ